MSLEEVSEILDYLYETPLEHEILAAVHEIKPRKRVKSPRELDERSYTDFGNLPEYGLPPDAMPSDFKDAVNFAADLQKQLFKEKT